MLQILALVLDMVIIGLTAVEERAYYSESMLNRGPSYSAVLPHSTEYLFDLETLQTNRDLNV